LRTTNLRTLNPTVSYTTVIRYKAAGLHTHTGDKLNVYVTTKIKKKVMGVSGYYNIISMSLSVRVCDRKRERKVYAILSVISSKELPLYHICLSLNLL
jgi:hypothetical protein